MCPDVMAVPLTPMSHTTFTRHAWMSQSLNPTDAGRPTRQRIANDIQFSKYWNDFTFMHNHPKPLSGLTTSSCVLSCMVSCFPPSVIAVGSALGNPCHILCLLHT